MEIKEERNEGKERKKFEIAGKEGLKRIREKINKEKGQKKETKEVKEKEQEEDKKAKEKE